MSWGVCGSALKPRSSRKATEGVALRSEPESGKPTFRDRREACANVVVMGGGLRPIGNRWISHRALRSCTRRISIPTAHLGDILLCQAAVPRVFAEVPRAHRLVQPRARDFVPEVQQLGSFITQTGLRGVRTRNINLHLSCPLKIVSTREAATSRRIHISPSVAGPPSRNCA